MSGSEWEEKKITPKKVIGKLKRVLAKQSKKEEDKIALVKTNRGLRMKGYSIKTVRKVNADYEQPYISFNEMIVNGKYPFADKKYYKLFKRKQRDYLNQGQSFKKMTRDKEIDEFLEKTSFTDYDKEAESTNAEGMGIFQETYLVPKAPHLAVITTKRRRKNQKPPRFKQMSIFDVPIVKEIFPSDATIFLNKIQKEDLGLLLQKRFALLTWQQGGGKSLAAMTWFRWLFHKKKIDNVFLIGPAIAIKLTWKVRLAKYKINFLYVQKEEDLDKIKPGQTVIISLSILPKIQKKLKNIIKSDIGFKRTALVVDESDNLSNYRSKRTKATIDIFRKVSYKLLTTGTATRNNLSEVYPQFELLYNNTYHMINHCENIYRRRNGDLSEEENPYYLKPFPAYRGLNNFKQSFCPTKTTVFGVKKHDQNIYNGDTLSRLIDKTIITRKFEEICGEKKYKIITHSLDQSGSEIDLYSIIMNEFYKMYHYYENIANESERKKSLLKIIRQIQKMIKACSNPQSFDEYFGPDSHVKADYINKLIDKWNTKTALGTLFIETAHYYYNRLKKDFPEREVFLILGDTDFKKRLQIIDDFQKTENGILISTQQSLESSVDIESCDKCILESLNWNLSRMSQYYFRFIRFTSKRKKEVHFVSYSNTIEQNILALVMAKEKMNEFVKTTKEVGTDELFGEFDIDPDIFNSIIEKARDHKGKTYLKWGSQKVA